MAFTGHGFTANGGQVQPTVRAGTEPPQALSDRSGPDVLRPSSLLATLDELCSLAAGLLTEGAQRNLAAARARVAEGRFNLVVLGEFKRGKSTLINALLDRAVLPTGVVPLTSAVTTIRAGERDRLIIRYADGREVERPITELADYVTEARNPGNSRHVELARIELDHDLLRAGLELIDTPGIGSIHSHNTATTRDFLPQVDAGMCVLDAGQPLSESERELLLEAAARVPRLLVVINKIDHLAPGERAEAVDFVRSGLRDLLGDAEPELFVVSARDRDGLVPLSTRLRRLAADERAALLLRSVARLAQGAARDTAQAARFEAHANELPLNELASRARAFEERIEELTAARAETADLLDRGIKRAVQDSINQPLGQHARHQTPRLHAALHRHVEELGKPSPRELSVQLEAWIERTVRADFERLVPHLESAIAEQLTQLEQRHAARVQRLLEQVQEIAEDVFGARASEVLPETGLRAPSRFSFKLNDVEHALDILVGFGRTVTPGSLGRKLVVRDAEQRLIDMTDRHAGRLRSELADRVSAAVREYQRELIGAVDEAISRIRTAIDRATEDRSRGEQRTRGRLEHLGHIQRRCEQLATEMDTRIDAGTATVSVPISVNVPR